MYGSFCEIDAFPLGVFSIRNFNLHLERETVAFVN